MAADSTRGGGVGGTAVWAPAAATAIDAATTATARDGSAPAAATAIAAAPTATARDGSAPNAAWATMQKGDL